MKTWPSTACAVRHNNGLDGGAQCVGTVRRPLAAHGAGALTELPDRYSESQKLWQSAGDRNRLTTIGRLALAKLGVASRLWVHAERRPP